MKNLLFIYLCLSSFTLFAQKQSNSDLVVKQLVEFYNKNEYNELYNQLSDNFRKQATDQQIITFYQSQLKQPLGQIKEWKYKQMQNSAAVYFINFERGSQELKIVVSDELKIDGMLWSRPQKAGKDPASIKTTNPKQTKIQLFVDSLAIAYLTDPGNSSLSIGLVTNGQTETFFYGETKKGTNKLPDHKSLYEIASISKTFTGIMLAHAINQRKLALSDRIEKYLPGNYANLQFKDEPLRIVHLSNHTSGLPSLPANFKQQPDYDPANPYLHYNRAMIYQYLSTFKPDTIPGYKAAYSNLGFGILGIILENNYHMSLDRLLQQIITNPLKMQNTSYDLTATQRKFLTTGYDNMNGKEAGYWNFGDFKACGGLKSDLHDMLLYLSANIAATNPDIALSQVPTNQQDGFSRGLAWMIEPMKNDTLIWHNGGTAGFRSYCGFVKKGNRGVVILSNSNAEVDSIALKLLSYHE